MALVPIFSISWNSPAYKIALHENRDPPICPSRVAPVNLQCHNLPLHNIRLRFAWRLPLHLNLYYAVDLVAAGPVFWDRAALAVASEFLVPSTKRTPMNHFKF
jgi:hypothetical protein